MTGAPLLPARPLGATPGRVWRTVRYLQPRQLAWRLVLKGRRRLDRALPAWSLPRARAGDRWAATLPAGLPALHVVPGRAAAIAAALDAGTLRLLNETLPFAGAERWRLGGVTTARLWTITLHYHEWLVALAADDAPGALARRERAWTLLADWLEACDVRRPGAAALAWNSFAIATRLRWWGRLLASPAAVHLPASLRDALAASAAVQARMLAARLERDLQANHFLRDAVGLAWAAALLDVPERDAWRRTAAAIARSEARVQVLPDGGHVERSAMYHAHVLEDFAELASLLPADDAGARAARGAAARLVATLAWLRGADGALVRFNDGGPSGAPDPTELASLLGSLALAEPPPPRGTHHLADYGLVCHAGRRWGVHWDVGPVGPDWQPGHAHADTLALEATLDGRPLLVDRGTYAYDRDARRRDDRATRSHNTVAVDGLDSSECWDIFRVGRRARPLAVHVQATVDGFTGEAAHDGYRHLAGTPVHRRRVTVSEAPVARLVIEDEVLGGGTRALEGGWLLHPHWRAEVHGAGWMLTGPGRVRVTLSLPPGGRWTVEPAPWHPDYGVAVPTTRLAWSVPAAPLPLQVRVDFETEDDA